MFLYLQLFSVDVSKLQTSNLQILNLQPGDSIVLPTFGLSGSHQYEDGMNIGLTSWSFFLRMFQFHVLISKFKNNLAFIVIYVERKTF